jgi:hypothetical protein
MEFEKVKAFFIEHKVSPGGEITDEQYKALVHDAKAVDKEIAHWILDWFIPAGSYDGDITTCGIVHYHSTYVFEFAAWSDLMAAMELEEYLVDEYDTFPCESEHH